MKRDRAYRRNMRERRLAQVRRMLSSWTDSWSSRYDEVFIVRLASYRGMCSGPCCGNPRYWNDELTVQEIQALDQFEAELEELECK